MAPAVEEGYVSFRGHRTWYRAVGETEEGRSPLLVLHGGPGTSHDYLEPLEDMARTGRKVFFYDQMGCGRSDHPHDPGLLTVASYLDEVTAVREQLGLERAHVLGQSWGGLLAMEHALSGANGIESLVLCDPLTDTRQWISEANRLRSLLPADVQEALLRNERAGNTDSAEYQDAMMVYYRRHVCRMDPWPEYLERSLAHLAADPEVYAVMWGPSEFFMTGTLKDWTVLPRIGRIMVPTLLLSGRHDEATPAIVGAINAGIEGSEWQVFEDSSHMPHAEERERFMGVLGGFLDRVERRTPSR